jgi:hypothetical protein
LWSSSYLGKVPKPKRQIPRNQAEKAEVLKAETGTNPFTGGNEGNGEVSRRDKSET